jgi:hypothetical protein
MIIVDDVGTQGTRYPFQGPRELRQLMDVLFFLGNLVPIASRFWISQSPRFG